MSQAWVGIHMGVTMISVSMFRGTKCELILQTPPYVTFAETGEILAGSRAQRYFGAHKEAPLYSVFDIMKNSRSFRTSYVSYKGVKRSAQELCVEFVKNLKKQLEERLGDDFYTWNCILSVPLAGLFYRENLKKIMSEAGFAVKRILQDSVSCAAGELYNRKNSGRFLSLVVERSMLNASFVEYGDGLQEVLCAKTFVVEGASSMNSTELSLKGYQLMEKAFPDFRNKLAKAEVKVYSGAYFVGKRPGNAGSLDLYASEGAAVICEKLRGTMIESIKELLLLDTTAMAYGIEIVDREEKIVRPLEWIVTEQESIPVRSGVEWECNHSGENLRLRVYGNLESRKEDAEVFEIGLENAINSIAGGYKKLSLSLDLDANKNLFFHMVNVESGERYTLNIIGTVSAKGDGGYGLYGEPVQLWKKTVDEIQKVQRMINKLEYEEMFSPTGKGLLMVAKLCNKFLQQNTLDKIQQCVKSESEIIRVVEELLLIADGLEYGVRKIPEKSTDRAEICLMESYLIFMNFLKEAFMVVPIPAEGMNFDINLHYAVMHEDNEQLKDNLVVGEIQRGYYWVSKVIRPSKVKVVN